MRGRFTLFCGVSFCLLVLGVPSAGATAPTFTGISTGYLPSALASAVVKTIPVGASPIDVSSDGTHAWVANEGADTVSEIGASTGTVVNTIPVPPVYAPPTGVSSDGTHVWVTNNGPGNSVSEIDASTGTVIKTTQVDTCSNFGSPYGVSSDRTHVWVTIPECDAVIELDASTGTVVGGVSLLTGDQDQPTRVSSDGTHVWVTNLGGSTVSEIDASTGTVVNTIPPVYHLVGVSSDGTHVWVTASDWYANGDGVFLEFDASTGTEVKGGEVGKGPTGVSSDGTHVWVTNSRDNTVSEIDASTGTVVNTIPVGKDPTAVSSDGTHVWVTNSLDNTVSEIEITQVQVPISGTVNNKYGRPLPDVKIAITGAGTAMTDANGHYSIEEPPGTYTITPQPANGLYTPQASSDCKAQADACAVTATADPVEADFVARHLPVVLVTGLSDQHEGMTPGGDCGRVGSMASLCASLQGRSFPVYVPSASDVAGDVIMDTGNVRPNAARLAAYLDATVHGPVLLVGHSMGGLFSRDAMALYAARAVGLFTIGTPFDGSYGADIAETDSQAHCAPGDAGSKCRKLKAAAEVIADALGAAAVADLTAASRHADNSSLPKPGVPTWTMAGTACTAVTAQAASDSYEYPNDGIVGHSSAWGATANLGSPTRLNVNAYHSPTITELGVYDLLPSNCDVLAPVELKASYVETNVLRAALRLDSVSDQPNLRGPTASDKLSASRKPASFTVNLQTLTVRSIRPGAAIPLGPSGFVSTETAFRLSCPHTAPIESQPVLGSSKLFAVPGAAFKCPDPSLTAAKPVAAMIASDPDRVRARFTRTPRGYKISITALKALSRIVLERHGKRVRVKLHWRTRRSVSLSLTSAQASQITLTATANRLRYSTSL